MMRVIRVVVAALVCAIVIPSLALAVEADNPPAGGWDISAATVTGIRNTTYTGGAKEPKPVVVLDGKTLKENSDYFLEYRDNIDAGTATVEIYGEGNYIGYLERQFNIAKAKNSMKLDSSKLYVSKRTLKQNKKQKIFLSGEVLGPDTKITFKLVSVPKQDKRYIKLASNGVITAKKGLKGGTHRLKVGLTSQATNNYKKTAVVKDVKIVVKKNMGKYPSLSRVGISGYGYGSKVDAKLDAAIDDMVCLLANRKVSFSRLNKLTKASCVMNYIGSHYYYKYYSNSSAKTMLTKGYGTCFAYSDLTYCMARKVGLKKSWLTVPSRNVNHDGNYYGSQHRSVVTKIGKKYYELDANLCYVMGGASPEKISASYAKYLLGKKNSYTRIK